MAGASMLAIECQEDRIHKRLETGYLDAQAKDLDDALAIIRRQTESGEPLSVGLLGNAAEILPAPMPRRPRTGRRRWRPLSPSSMCWENSFAEHGQTVLICGQISIDCSRGWKKLSFCYPVSGLSTSVTRLRVS